MSKIYAAIIGKNEDGVLERCLKSLKGLDGIFFTDTGSTDRTVEIAKKHNCKISFFQWCDDFSKARNFNLKQIPADAWKFIIDCDEWIPDGTVSKIRAAARKSKTGAVFAYSEISHGGGFHQHLRLFKGNLRYKDPVHTHIPVRNFERSTIWIYHKPSPNHQKDPDRTLRILQKIKNPSTRELFLLGRELMGKRRYKEALKYFEKYAKYAEVTEETQHALIYSSQCLFQIEKVDDAQEAALQAVKFNPDSQEALIAMATCSNPWRALVWLRFAEMAKNENINTIPGYQDRKIKALKKIFELGKKGVDVEKYFEDKAGTPKKEKKEKPASYYDEAYKNNSNMTRYENIYRLIGHLATGNVLDVGCGTGELRNYIKNYYGFDFSEIAVDKANADNVVLGNVYNKSCYEGADTYVFCEVLEHLNRDKDALSFVPKGKHVILTVPSFDDPAHLRTYKDFSRYKKLIKIKKIYRFNWKNKWVLGGPKTENYILLADACRI